MGNFILWFILGTAVFMFASELRGTGSFKKAFASISLGILLGSAFLGIVLIAVILSLSIIHLFNPAAFNELF